MNRGVCIFPHGGGGVLDISPHSTEFSNFILAAVIFPIVKPLCVVPVGSTNLVYTVTVFLIRRSRRIDSTYSDICVGDQRGNTSRELLVSITAISDWGLTFVSYKTSVAEVEATRKTSSIRRRCGD